MAVERRAGAPRLIDWTGERCVPWTPDVQVVYEHYHRYLWTAELVRGRRVLDVGSGEGFGSAILAGTAESVLGIDIDATTVQHSQLNYAAPGLEFQVGSALELEALAPRSFDAIVLFELIEHVTDHERVLAGIQSLLAPGGVVVMSTPDRRLYSEATGQANPFHEHELTEAELRALVDGAFAHSRIFGQRAAAGSRIVTIDVSEPAPAQAFTIAKLGDDWHVAGPAAPMYLLAVASDAELPPLPTDSTLADYSLRIVSQWADRAGRAEHETGVVSKRLGETAQAYEGELARAAERERQLRAEMTFLHSSHAAKEQAVEATRRQLDELSAATAADGAELRRVRESVMWSALQRARWKFYAALGGRESRRGRALQWSLRATRRRFGDARETQPSAPPPIEPIHFQETAAPLVSIVVSAYIGADVTAACLRSIAACTVGPSYEVIVVDDAADDDNARLWEAVSGAQILVNNPGIGYLRSVNRGAAAARGRYLVLMNNDVEVELGWLEALVARAESSPDIGAVAPKLLYPDGTLQEAGSIIWQDGTGWNFGRSHDPEHHEYNYVREIDYGSAACLLVRADAFTAVGGYDERFLPMYYEDTDLCFALRDAGLRVLFEPRSRVVHHEGVSAGTDPDSGGKRHQELNRPRFVEKWRETLERDHLRSSPSNVRRASNRAAGPHVLVIDHRVPTPDQDSGSLRMLRLLESLVELGCRVTFAPDDLARPEPYTSELEAMGIDVVYGHTWIGQEIALIGPQLKLAIVSRPYVAAQYMHMLREHAPSATIAYDTVDLHFVREQRRADLGEPHARRKAETMRELELGLVRGSDVTIVVSEEEREPLHDAADDNEILVVPNANEIAERVPPPSGRAGILFVGGFEHPPNVDAALILVQAVMPIVWSELGDVRVTIAGSKPTPEIEQLAGPNVDVTGWVDDLRPLLDGARVMAAPLRYGAGMKGKVTQSLGLGLPVVTTATGAEGLGVTDGRELLIGESAEELAERIVRVYRDDALWQQLSDAGRETTRRVASVEVMRERLRELLERGA